MNDYTKFPDKYYVKENVDLHEFNMQTYVYNLSIVSVPEVLYYCKETRTMAMARVDGMNISDMYGEDATMVPDNVFKSISTIIKKLVDHGIEYPDLTGYNFVEDADGKVWIIDFEHSKLKSKNLIDNNSILRVCRGEKKWNEDFA